MLMIRSNLDDVLMMLFLNLPGVQHCDIAFFLQNEAQRSSKSDLNLALGRLPILGMDDEVTFEKSGWFIIEFFPFGVFQSCQVFTALFAGFYLLLTSSM